MTTTNDLTRLIDQCRRAFSLARLADRMDCPVMARGYRATGRMLRRAIRQVRWDYKLRRWTQAI